MQQQQQPGNQGYSQSTQQSPYTSIPQNQGMNQQPYFVNTQNVNTNQVPNNIYQSGSMGHPQSSIPLSSTIASDASKAIPLNPQEMNYYSNQGGFNQLPPTMMDSTIQPPLQSYQNQQQHVQYHSSIPSSPPPSMRFPTQQSFMGNVAVSNGQQMHYYHQNPSTPTQTHHQRQSSLYQNPLVALVGQSPPIQEFFPFPSSSIGGEIGSVANSGSFPHSQYMQCTLKKIPKTSSILSKTKIPLAISLTPYIEGEQVELCQRAIVRCQRCRTYLNPFVTMIDQGLRWKCNICQRDNDFPMGFDCETPSVTIDRATRPELSKIVYEFIAPMEYMVRAPQPLAFCFLLDVSHGAMVSGLFSSAIRIIKETLSSIPNHDGRTLFSIITFDNNVHFYHFNHMDTGGEPKFLVVTDANEMFLPVDHDLLVSLKDYQVSIENLLSKITNLFTSSFSTGIAFGSAITAARLLMSPHGGKIVAFISDVPNIHDGSLRSREDQKAWGTGKESNLLQPVGNTYKLYATEMARTQVCLDLFACPINNEIDLATLSGLARYTGGKLFYYPKFNSGNSEQVLKLNHDLSSLLTEQTGLEAVIRIRASQPLMLHSYHGSFFLRSTDLLALPNLNPSHSFAAEINIEEAIQTSHVYFQTAVLLTTCYGERRIRVINMALPVSDNLKEIISSVDQFTLGSILLKMSVEKALNTKLEDAREALISKCIDILNAIRTHFGIGQNLQLLVPENLRLLPLIVLGILKTICLRSGALTSPDLRIYEMMLAKTMSVNESIRLIYPYLFSLHDINIEDQNLPPPIPLSSEKLERHGLYILDNGQDFFFWVGSLIHPELCNLIFGSNYAELESCSMILLRNDNPYSQRLCDILSRLRRKEGKPGNSSMTHVDPLNSSLNSSPLIVEIIKEDDKNSIIRQLFTNRLIEDKTMDNQMSYNQFLVLQREKAGGSNNGN